MKKKTSEKLCDWAKTDDTYCRRKKTTKRAHKCFCAYHSKAAERGLWCDLDIAAYEEEHGKL